MGLFYPTLIYPGAPLAAGSNTGNTSGNTASTFGTWVIAGSNNITISGSTATNQVHTAWINGPAPPTQSQYINPHNWTRLSRASAYTNRPFFIPFYVNGTGLIASRIRMLWERSAGTSLNGTFGVAIYRISNSSVITLAASTSMAISITTSADWSGVRMVDFTGMSTYTIPQGDAILGIYVHASDSVTNNADFNFYGVSHVAPVGFLFPGTNSTAATAAGSRLYANYGVYSSTTATNAMFPSPISSNSIIHASTQSVGFVILGSGY